MKPCFKSWIASSLSLLAMTRKVAMKGKVAMTGKVTITEGLDCVVADASRNDGEGGNDGGTGLLRR